MNDKCRWALAIALLLGACTQQPNDVVAGDPTRGRIIAEQNCSGCHRVSPDQETVQFSGPPDFAQINSLPPEDWQPVVNEMASTHIAVPVSPDWVSEKADVIAWILSLEPEPLPEPEPETIAE